MRFDTIIIGGGHSGLTRGLEELAAGRSCLAVCTGESSRRFRDGAYSHQAHIREFKSKGGTFFFGDSVTGGEFRDGRLTAVFTENHGHTRFEADNFVIATGSFFSCGLVAFHDCIIEPVLGLDVDYCGHHSEWVVPDFYGEQPFMKFGIITDGGGHPYKEGQPVGNLTAAGSIISRL